MYRKALLSIVTLAVAINVSQSAHAEENYITNYTGLSPSKLGKIVFDDDSADFVKAIHRYIEKSTGVVKIDGGEERFWIASGSKDQLLKSDKECLLSFAKKFISYADRFRKLDEESRQLQQRVDKSGQYEGAFHYPNEGFKLNLTFVLRGRSDYVVLPKLGGNRFNFSEMNDKFDMTIATTESGKCLLPDLEAGLKERQELFNEALAKQDRIEQARKDSQNLLQDLSGAVGDSGSQEIEPTSESQSGSAK